MDTLNKIITFTSGDLKPEKFNSPLVDICCIIGVESLLHECSPDPYAKKLAASFADFFIWNEHSRFLIPTQQDILANQGIIGVPSLIIELIKRDSASLKPQICILDQRHIVNEEDLLLLFNEFLVWAFQNKNRLNCWIELHNEPWIKDYHNIRIQSRYVYNVDMLKKSPELFTASTSLEISNDNLCYFFDLSLRYQLYGQYVGNGKYYLSHPIREQQNFSNIERKQMPSPKIPIGLGKYLIEFATPGNLDLFSAVLHEARNIVRELKLVDYTESKIEKEVLRELASKLGLAPRLRNYDEIIKYLKILPILSTGVSLIDRIWKGTLPRNFAKFEWLHWAYEWDIEKES